MPIQVEKFVPGLHSRPFSAQLGASFESPTVEWDYGGKLTALMMETQLFEIEFPDVSYWQGNIDYEIMGEKTKVLMIRGIYGNSSVDLQLPNNKRGCGNKGIAYPLYHYLKPGRSIDLHVSTMDAVMRDSDSFAAVADVEETGGLDKTALESWVQKYVFRLEDKLGKLVLIYTSPYFWNTNLPRTDWAKDRLLHVANWTTYPLPSIPNDWGLITNPKEATWWQFTSKALGKDFGCKSTYMDYNRSLLNTQEFNLKFGTNIGLPQLPPPPEPPVIVFPNLPKARVLSKDGVNVRPYPSIGNVPIGVIPYGVDNIPVISAVVSGSDIWFRIGYTQYIAGIYRGYKYSELYDY